MLLCKNICWCSHLGCWSVAWVTRRVGWVWILAPHLWLLNKLRSDVHAVRLWWEALSEAQPVTEEYQSWVVGVSQQRNGVNLLHGPQMGLGISYSSWAMVLQMDEKGPQRGPEKWSCHALLSSMYVGTKGWGPSPLHTGDNTGQRLLSFGWRLRGCQDDMFQVLLHFLLELSIWTLSSYVSTFTVRGWIYIIKILAYIVDSHYSL